MIQSRFFILLLLVAIFYHACDNDAADAQAGFAETGDPAIDQLSADIEKQPDNAELYALRAELYYEKDGFDEAIGDLSKALAIDSTNVNYLHLLADVYMDYPPRSRQALETMEKAARLYPDRLLTLLKLSEFQLILKKYEEGLKTIDQVLQREPQNAEAYFMMGQIFREMGDLNRAINSLQTAVEVDPELVDGWVGLGKLHAIAGTGLEERFFNTAIDVDQNSVLALHAKADYLTDQNRLSEAIELYRQSVIRDPQYVSAHINMGMLFLEMDSIGRAKQELDIATQMDPLDARPYYGLAFIEESTGDIEKAKAYYQQAIQLAPEFKEAQAALDRLNK